ncbi:hypothetical protein [Burkholderia cepacia]|uniref:hypothetical protein n=1 Tax=Burkholderia cepacia TaxID=292 RepID=UPI001CF55D24|nr:hypothetical protein [Burkholderia cepacia]MCA8075349.1 hypothetical protein [Burkholderia cepacia]
MPINEALTPTQRAVIMDACQSISRSADALKDCHTVDGDWGDDVDAKAFYDAELRLLDHLTDLLSATAQPVADDAAAQSDERAFETWWFEPEGFCLRAERFDTPDAAARAAWDERGRRAAEVIHPTPQAGAGRAEPRAEVTDKGDDRG